MDPLSTLLRSKTFFHAKNRPKPFYLRTLDGYGRSFRRHAGGKKLFIVNFQRSEFVCFWSVSRDRIGKGNNLLQKWGSPGIQESNIYVTHQNNQKLPVSEH